LQRSASKFDEIQTLRSNLAYSKALVTTQQEDNIVMSERITALEAIICEKDKVIS